MDTWKFLFVVAVLLGCGTDRVETVVPKKAPTVVLRQPISLVPPSEDEQRRFWEQNLHEVVVDRLMAGRYKVPEVAERFAHLRDVVTTRYQKELRLSLVTEYNPGSSAAKAGALVVGGEPTIELVIPAIMDEFNELQLAGADGWLEQLQLSVVVSVVHEMEHLAGDGFDDTDLVAEEARAWHLTCLYTLAPLIETHGLSVGPSASAYYRLWTEAGRTEGPVWNRAIGSIYNQIEGG